MIIAWPLIGIIGMFFASWMKPDFSSCVGVGYSMLFTFMELV